jgi:hypothetical protein
MDISLLVGIGLLVVAIILWKKYDDSNYFWISLIMGGGVLIGVVEHLSESFLQLSGAQRIIEFYVYEALRGAALIATVVFGLRILFNR